MHIAAPFFHNCDNLANGSFMGKEIGLIFDDELTSDRWFSPGTPVSSTNKTDRHDITELLLKVVLNTIPP